MATILSIGEKIRLIRKALGMTQPELGKEVITADRLCKMERGETTRIKKSDLEFLCIQFELKIKELLKNNKCIPEIVCDFSLAWLLESEEQQAIRIIDEGIELNNFTSKSIKMYASICNKHKLKETKIKLYKKVTDYFYMNCECEPSLKYCKLGYNLIKFKDKKVLDKYFFIKYMIKNYIRTEKWSQAFEYLCVGNDILKELKSISTEEKNNFYYNSSLVYKNMNCLDLALEYLQKIKMEELTEEKKMDLRIQIITLKVENKKINEAINELQELLKLKMNDTLKSRCYSVLGECYHKKRELEEAKKYIDKCNTIRQFNTKKPHKYFYSLNLASEIYYDMNLLIEAEKLLIKGINIYKEAPIDRLMNFYIKTNQPEKILEFQFKNYKKMEKDTLSNVVIFLTNSPTKKNKDFLKKFIQNTVNTVDSYVS